VSASGVNLALDGHPILHNINLHIQRGEFITILGPSGSGKTTLLKSLLGFYIPQSGEISMAGYRVTGRNLKLIRGKTGYMPQSFESARTFPILARDVIAIGTKKGADPSAAVKELGIEKLLNKHFGSLSGGEKQKVMLAMMLARNPGIMLLDEPNLNLDMRSYSEFLKLVEKVHLKYGHTVIFVTHLISHIPGSCKRIAVMKQGRIIHDGPKSGVIKRKDMTEFLYG
jgi:ABC-type Mn2+/Zn2+ transport system ATPase subunit